MHCRLPRIMTDEACVSFRLVCGRRARSPRAYSTTKDSLNSRRRHFFQKSHVNSEEDFKPPLMPVEAAWTATIKGAKTHRPSYSECQHGWHGSSIANAAAKRDDLIRECRVGKCPTFAYPLCKMPCVEW